ncbi:protein of unknown function DUF1555 [Cyanobacterium stanieri PCC 7202]|uniref:PEP motif anchor domain protein n=1 Tax=Cyanobacterium stanieri (strain ATCC 29140 / PCC 7202) TaxID=292563 RepID=K9YPA6_CYASC|nr:protein of unknown function DUF1555 [Cyanobacterium stanieri PCC 7202]
MKIKSTAQLLGVGLGTALGSLALLSAPAFSATLINEGNDEDAFIDKYGITKIGEVECKAGGSSRECFFGLNGSSTGTPQSDLDFVWSNGLEYQYTLTWDPTKNEAVFTFFDPFKTFDSDLEVFIGGDRSINYTFEQQELDQFNAFGLITKVDTQLPSNGQTVVDNNTTITLGVDTVEFVDGDNNSVLSPETLNISVSSTSPTTLGQQFNKLFYVINDTDRAAGVEIGKMTGFFSLDWDDINPQTSGANARVSFELKLFDPPGTSSTVTTPEPTVILGLLGVGTLGIVSKKRKTEV